VLILTRRTGENVIVGDDIIISILDIRGDSVRVGIQAPKSLTVHREEVWLELRQANAASAASSGPAVDAVLAGLLAKKDQRPTKA
jgi:carbon storage regulator